VSPFVIYALIDPRTEEPFYIGQSTRGLDRAKEHDRTGTGAKAAFIKKLKGNFTAQVLEELPTAARLNQAEVDWIAAARATGWRLVNVQAGGYAPARRPRAALRPAPILEERREAARVAYAGARPMPALMSQEEAAAALRVSVDVLRGLVRRGLLAGVLVGRRGVVTRRDLFKFLTGAAEAHPENA
jgi:hypothetical protein